MNIKISAGLGIALLLTALAGARAEVPRTIAFQGVLKDAAGKPGTTTKSVTFTLYDAATEGNAVWTETKDITPDASGVFATPLGSATPMASVVFDKAYWVGVKVGADAEMTPRTALQSVPYAMAMPGIMVTPDGTRIGGDTWLDMSRRVGVVLNDGFNYNGNRMGNYSLGWFVDSELPGGGTAWLSGYNGIKFFTAGQLSLWLSASGGVYIRGSASCQTLTLTSSNRFKQNVQPLAGALDSISGLQGVSYTWDDKHGGRKDIGFIAEDVAKVIPELVTMEPDGVNAQGMDYSHLTALTVEAIKEQQTQIATLKAENAALKARLARVERLLTPKSNTKPGK